MSHENEKRSTEAQEKWTPIIVGQTYRRRSGPWFECTVVALKGDLAMCEMYDTNRSYGVRPVDFALLHSTQFKLIYDAPPAIEETS